MRQPAKTLRGDVMVFCDQCNNEFEVFETPGKCPLCAQWFTVECTGCGQSGPAIRFIEAGKKCPKCGREATIPGISKTPVVLVAGLIAVIVAFILLIYVFATLKPNTRDLPDIEARPIQTPN